MGAYEAIRTIQGHTGTYVAIQYHTGPYKTIQAHDLVYGTIRGNTGPYGAKEREREREVYSSDIVYNNSLFTC